MGTVLLIIGLVLFIFLVVAHEFGHFMVARRNGVVAEEFGIFFPPKLFKKRIKSKRGDFDFTINLIPLGGFVRLLGEHDDDTAKGSFGAASLWVKSKIMLAGVAMNLFIVVVLLSILAVVGMPKLMDNQFTVKSDTHVTKSQTLAIYIEPHSPAAKAGITQDDEIVSLGLPGKTNKVTSPADLSKLTQKYAGKTVELTYLSEGRKITKSVQLRSDKAIKGKNKGHLGVAPRSYIEQRSTWSAPIVGVGLTAQYTKLTFQGLGRALSGVGGIIAGFVSGNHTARETAQTEASSQVSGPVGVFYILKSGSVLGYGYMLMIVAVVSLSLAIFNVLPIPALDGGRFWWTLAAHAVHKPLSAKAEEIINTVGFVLIIALVILITVVDIKRF